MQNHTPSHNKKQNDLTQQLYLTLVQDDRLWWQDLETALRLITEKTCEFFRVGRSSVWTLNENGELYCQNLYESKDKHHSTGTTLLGTDYPDYFFALASHRIIDAHDAHTDPRTYEFSKTYLKPLGIGAMLDATLRTRGITSGVICLEQLGGPRLWTQEEKSTVLTLADLISQLLIHHDLAKTVNRYEGLLRNMPSAVYRCDNDKKWTMHYISPGISQISGYPASDFILNKERSYKSLIHPDDQERTNRIVAKSIEENKDFELEYRLFHKNGEIQWIQEFGRAVHRIDGSIAFIDGVINNVTEQKLARQVLEEQKQIVFKVSQALSRATGQQFFKTLTAELASVLQMDYVFIGVYEQDEINQVKTIAVHSHGKHLDNFSYELQDTPCAEIIKSGVCCYPHNVQHKYPDDTLLRDMGVEGYLGAPLFNSKGEPLGIMVVLSHSEIKNAETASELLTIFGVRAGAELERQLAEIQLKESQLHYKNLFESAGDAILLVKDGIFRDCNKTTLTMFGCRRDDIISRGPLDFSPEIQPDGSKSETKALEKINSTMLGETQHFEWQHQKLDGTPFDAEVTLSKISIADEQVLLAIIRDVSERSFAEKTILKQSEQLRASVEALPGIFYMLDANGLVVHYNDAYLNLYNLSNSEMSQHHMLSYVHPDDLPHAQNSIKNVLEYGDTVRFETRVLTNHGTGPVVHLLATGSRLYLNNEPYLVGAAIDITERVLAEEQIEEYQKTLQERNQNLQLINTISNQLHGQLDECLIYKYAATNLGDLPHRPCVLISSINEQGEFKITGCANLPSNLDIEALQSNISNALYATALQEKRITISLDIHNEAAKSQLLTDAMNGQHDITSMVCIPMFDKQELIGIINLLYRDKQTFSELEITTLESISKNVVISVVNARHAKRLEHQASHDPLTGLPNRSALHNNLKQLINCEDDFALMLIDLDRFKEVNDTLGHTMGDKLLCNIAPRIKHVLNQQDIFLSRLGGDEFALVIRHIRDMDSVKSISQLVLNAIRRPFDIDEVALELGASIGVVVHDNENIDSHELLRRSDVAMYYAKQKCSGYYIYEPSIDTHTREKLAMMSNLRTAINEDQFILHFQPKFDIKQNQHIGFEALIRWQHPEQGMIYPDHFIELVEMSDLIHPLTDLVIRKAIQQLTQWQKEYHQEFSVAINISTRNLLDQDFPKQLANLLKETRFDPALLELEITESALISDPARSREILNAITALGVKLSIDDFGTGYSSLAYLKQLPIQTLKIDRSFVMEMESNNQDELIVSSTITLAHNLGLEVVAEGVENETVLQKLSDMGCDYAQGYHLSRPLPADEIAELIWPNKQ